MQASRLAALAPLISRYTKLKVTQWYRNPGQLKCETNSIQKPGSVLDQDVVLGSRLCESSRHLSERWSEAVSSSCGLRTLNERINQIAPLLAQAHHTPITQVPPMIQFDGIWLRLQVPTGTVKTDRRRRRQQHKGKRMVLLVALGLWTDGSGRREILD